MYTRTTRTVVVAADPKASIADEMPSFCRSVAGHLKGVTVAYQPRVVWYDQIGAAGHWSDKTYVNYCK